MRGKSAIAREAGELRKAARAVADFQYVTDHLMGGNDRQRSVKVAVNDMKVRPAHSASGDLDQQLAFAGRRPWPLHGPEGLPRSVQLHGQHRCGHGPR